MTRLSEQRVAEIRGVLADVLEVDESRIGEDTLFKEDLDADSMKLIEVLARLEIEYDVEIDESELDRMVNLRGVCEVLAQALGAQEKAAE
ncbi:MAG: acyl carrier protein [Sciscionella sp.]|nr:acyl carrier protein [Sciscionella sp.]